MAGLPAGAASVTIAGQRARAVSGLSSVLSRPPRQDFRRVASVGAVSTEDCDRVRSEASRGQSRGSKALAFPAGHART